MAAPPMPNAVTLTYGMERFGRMSLKGGEFVWGKVKGHGYWPGRVATPSQVTVQTQRFYSNYRSHILAGHYSNIHFETHSKILLG